jgi:hypothetical protein
MSAGPSIDELFVAAVPDTWRAAGFEVQDDGLCVVGAVRIRLDGGQRGRGIVGWSVRGAITEELDGLPTTRSTAAPPEAPDTHHRNGAVSVDHLVVITPALDRTTAALRAAGFDLRREREGPAPGGSRRQSFFRMGDVILEVVEAPAGTRIAEDPNGPALLWGISFLVDELEHAAASLGDLLGDARAAVQPGRRIATVKKEAGLGPAIAFMTPGPGAIAV